MLFLITNHVAINDNLEAGRDTRDVGDTGGDGVNDLIRLFGVMILVISVMI